MSKILLAEDDIDMRRFLVKALQNAGFEVTSYDNGLSAYQRLREEPFELLLTDIVMPEMDGIELARRAAELDPDIKIMFITGFAAVALNSNLDRAPTCQSAIEAHSFARAGHRSSEIARRLKRGPPASRGRSGHSPLLPHRARSVSRLDSFDAEIARNVVGARRMAYHQQMPPGADALRH